MVDSRYLDPGVAHFYSNVHYRLSGVYLFIFAAISVDHRWLSSLVIPPFWLVLSSYRIPSYLQLQK